MIKLRLFGLAAVAAIAAGANPYGQGASTTAFVGVNVIPMTMETVLTGQTVIVRDGRVVAVGPAASTQVPADATRVDGSGKYLMPAIAEMHAHIPGAPPASPFPAALAERTLLLYAARGIGTIRGMLGHPEHLKYRERVEKGELISPRIYTSGPSFNGNSVPTVAAAVKAVEMQKEAGYDLLKIHPGVKRDVFDALAAKAHELKIPFAGHVPLDVGLHRALEARYRCIDHVDGYIEALSDKPMTSEFFGINLVNSLDESKIPELVKATKAAGTWIVATQVLFDNLVGPDSPEEMAKWPEMQYAEPAGVVQKWIAQKQNMAKYPAADRQKFLAVRRRIIKALHDGGVPFALGSDAPQWWNVPGFSTHRELQSMVKAGLTPYQALRSGTVNIGTYFGTPDVGAVAAGQRADLVLLDANPLQEVANSLRIAGVMLNGRWLPAAELEKRLRQGS
ncbi:MAG TPA: amidohydrolase family protein [Vicinamibacterales bacterium]|nr:amidohydrolase family protein [Vicinamibacterales bacterium]